MDWGAIAEATFLFTVALVAILVTLYVVASSLLGRAVEFTREEKKRRLAKQSSVQEAQINKAREELSKLAKTRGTEKFKIEQAKKSIEDLEKQQEVFSQELKDVQRNYSVFTVEGGVVYPAYYFLASLLLSGAAWGLGNSALGITIDGLWIPTPTILWILSLLGIGFGIHRIFINLIRIQRVALTSEEAALRRMVDAFKIAQREVEAERKPEVTLKFENHEPPLTVAAGDDFTLSYFIELTKGDVAHHIQTSFIASKGFEFLSEVGTKGYQSGKADLYPDCPRIRFDTDEMLPFHEYRRTIEIKAPTESGNYKMLCSVQCPGYAGVFEEIDVEVTPQTPST